MFLNYEYEREPQTFVYTTPYPTFNFDQTGTRREHKMGDSHAVLLQRVRATNRQPAG